MDTIKAIYRYSLQISAASWFIFIIFASIGAEFMKLAVSKNIIGTESTEEALASFFAIIAFLGYPVSFIALVLGIISIKKKYKIASSVLAVMLSASLFLLLSGLMMAAFLGGT